MKVLFIGGTGLISTAIARQLLQAGHDITLFNRGKSQSRLIKSWREQISHTEKEIVGNAD